MHSFYYIPYWKEGEGIDACQVKLQIAVQNHPPGMN